ncbi:hypothetical protein Tco_0162652 [Tanacetum coccineum]
MAPPVRTDEQILPRIRWVPIGKSNCYLNEEKSQPSLIFKIAVDILKQTNFFRSFIASSTIPAIYIQHFNFWDTIVLTVKLWSYNYRCGKNFTQSIHNSQKTEESGTAMLKERKSATIIPDPKHSVFWETAQGKFSTTTRGAKEKGKEKVVVRSEAQDEFQADQDLGTLDEGQAGPNPDDVAESTRFAQSSLAIAIPPQPPTATTTATLPLPPQPQQPTSLKIMFLAAGDNVTTKTKTASLDLTTTSEYTTQPII